jgi:undecaprenyl-diphosphatase
MSLIESLVAIDKSLFLAINGANNLFLDGVMYAISAKFTWVPLYLAVLYVVIKQWKKDALWVVVSLVVCILISDQVASGVIKNLVHRLRPSHLASLSGVVHLVKDYSGGLYGFASSHASNSVGFAVLSSLFLRERKYTVAISFWAILVCYSRIYLGVHYPLDIIGGALVGTGAALACWYVVKLYRPSLFDSNRAINTIIPVAVVIASSAVLLAYSLFVF